MSQMTHQNKIYCLCCTGGQLDEFLSQILLCLSSSLYKDKSSTPEDACSQESVEGRGVKVLVDTTYEFVCLQSLCGIKFIAHIGVLYYKIIRVEYFVKESDLLKEYVLPRDMVQDDFAQDSTVSELVRS